MGTVVLHPQNCLVERLVHVPSTSFYSCRRPYHGNSNPITNSLPSSNANPKARPSRRPEPKKRREASPRPLGSNKKNQNLVMGQVTILRRGESLDAKESRSLSKEGEGAVLTSDEAGDLIVFGTERLGPDPEMVPRQIRLKDPKSAASDPSSYGYAGSAFSMSPSPRALPLPSFPRKKKDDDTAVPVDHSATKDLRRLLRLD